MKHHKRTGFITTAIFLMFYTACGGKGDNSDVTISISPMSPVITRVGESRTLNVDVRNTNNAAFELSVLPESGSGCVKNGGNVVCTPTAEGTYYVTVTAVANTLRFVSVFMIVDLREFPVLPRTWVGIDGGQSTFTSDNDIYGIAYGDGRFVAVGENGVIAYSTDGRNWTRSENGAFDSNKIFAVTYGSGLFIAGGQNGVMAYSTDGTNWIQVNGAFDTEDIRGIAYGDGMFIAVGHAGRMAHSADGINWTRVIEKPIGENKFYAVTYGDGTFVAVGENGGIAFSANGTNWTPVQYPANPFYTDSLLDTDIRSVAYGNEQFIAVGDYGRWASSADGITWWMYGISFIPWTSELADSSWNREYEASPLTLFDEDKIYGIAFGGEWFVAVGENGKMAYSAGGYWNATPVNPYVNPFGTDEIYGVAYGGGRFVAVGKSGKMAYALAYVPVIQ